MHRHIEVTARSTMRSRLAMAGYPNGLPIINTSGNFYFDRNGFRKYAVPSAMLTFFARFFSLPPAVGTGDNSLHGSKKSSLGLIHLALPLAGGTRIKFTPRLGPVAPAHITSRLLAQ